MIRDVEGLQPQLRLDMLRERKGLVYGGVEIDKAGTDERVPSDVAIGVWIVHNIRAGVEQAARTWTAVGAVQLGLVRPPCPLGRDCRRG